MPSLIPCTGALTRGCGNVVEIKGGTCDACPPPVHEHEPDVYGDTTCAECRRMGSIAVRDTLERDPAMRFRLP